MEQKKLVVNCDLCDTRSANEESLSGYEQIIINADIILINERSNAMLQRLPLICNADVTVDAGEQRVEIMTQNGSYELKAGIVPEGKAILIVNGSLRIYPGTEELLSRYLKIVVNGTVYAPESIQSCLGNLTVNGGSCCYPDDCVMLEDSFTVDQYFPLRAKEKTGYFAAERVFITDTTVNVKMLAEKGNFFVTKELVVSQELLEDALGLVAENVKLRVVPAAHAFVNADSVLDEALLRKFGKKLYIYGSLSLNEQSIELAEHIESLKVAGEVRLLRHQMESLEKLHAEYDRCVIVKGKTVVNKAFITVNNNLLNQSQEGVSITNCGTVTILPEVEAERISSLLELINVGTVKCTPSQRSAVELVSCNVGVIQDGIGEDGESVFGNIKEIAKDLLQSKIVNADEYIL